MFQEFFNYYDYWLRRLEEEDLTEKDRAEIQYCVRNIEKALRTLAE